MARAVMVERWDIEDRPRWWRRLWPFLAILMMGCSTTRPPANPAATHYEATIPGLPVPGGAVGGLYRAVDVTAIAPPTQIQAGQELQRHGLRFLYLGGILAAVAIAAHLLIRSAGPISIFVGHVCEWAFAAAAGLMGVGLLFVGMGQYLWIIIPVVAVGAMAMWYFRGRGITAGDGKGKHDDDKR